MLKKLLCIGMCFMVLQCFAVTKNDKNSEAKVTIIKFEAGKNIYKTGEDVSVKVEYKIKVGWVFAGFGVLGYFPYIPKECIDCGKFKINKRHDKRWSSVRFLNFKWLSKNSTKGKAGIKTSNVTFSTKDWPIGDYGVTLLMMFRDPSNKKDTKYLQKKVFFAINKNQDKTKKDKGSL